MSALPFTLDPEVEHILQEVARDPRSSLLRVERPKVIRGLLEREPSVGVATAGLTSAERHLVQTRRSETAYALRVLCLHALQTDSRGEHVFSRQGVLDTSDLARKLSAFGRSWNASEVEHVTDLGADADIVRRALAPVTTPSMPMLSLCTVAMRLEPTDTVRIYAAQWLSLDSQHRGALGLFLNVMTQPLTRGMSSLVEGNIGFVYNRLGDLGRSLDWYRRASEDCAGNTSPLVGRFAVAIQTGSVADFSRSAQMLDQLNTPTSSEVAWQCAAQRARRAEFESRLSPSGRSMFEKMKGSLGPVSRSLADAFM
jgi:hypothetical protein